MVLRRSIVAIGSFKLVDGLANVVLVRARDGERERERERESPDRELAWRLTASHCTG